jgi:hypothetical protein
MLSPKQFEALGRLTLAFNHIESAFETCAMVLLSPNEFAIGRAVVKEGTFQNKANRLRRILDALCTEDNPVRIFADPICEIIDKAKKLADERNGYVHALIDHDFRENKTWLRVRGRRVACDESAMLDLAHQMGALVSRLDDEFDDLIVELQKVGKFPTFGSNASN